MSKDSKKWIVKVERNISFLIVTVIMMACNGQKKMVEQKLSQVNEKLTLVEQHSYSGVDSTETLVIKNAKTLKSFYSRVNRTRKPGLPVPEIDFTSTMVIIFCSSDEVSHSKTGLAIIEETDTEMIFGIREIPKIEKNESNTNTVSLVSPFFVYKMPLTEKEVSFKKLN